MVDTVVTAQGVLKRFGRVTALVDLTLAVPAGAVFALVGPNGAGKSTAVRILTNVHRPTAGRASVFGVDTRKIGPDELRRIGYVSENQDLPLWMRVDEFLAYCRSFYPNWRDAEAGQLVRAFGLPTERQLSELSRGMRMKAALASVLAYRPELLILDEPFTALDVAVREQLIEEVLSRVPETTVLVASHDLGEIETFTSHVAYLSDGAVRFAEEITGLTGRFREVEVRAASVRGTPPDRWMQFERCGELARFVEPRFDTEETGGLVRGFFQGVLSMEARPMSLRSIVLALAKRGAR